MILSYSSLKNQIKHFGAIPSPNQKKKINYPLAAIIAHIDLSKQLIFSEDKIERHRDSLYNVWEATNPREFKDSKAYGLKLHHIFHDWMNKDNYAQTRTMPNLV